MTFLMRFRQIISRYFQERLFLLALVAILFMMGIIFGVLALGTLDGNQQQYLVHYIDQGLHADISLPNPIYTRQIVFSHLQTVFFLFLMGISVIGVPLALLLIFTRGFIIGFSVAFLFKSMGFKGFLLIIAGVLPHNLLIIPALFLMLVAMLDCAAALTKIRFGKYQAPLGVELTRNVLITILVLGVMVLAGFVQGYLTPWLTVWLRRLLI